VVQAQNETYQCSQQFELPAGPADQTIVDCNKLLSMLLVTTSIVRRLL
jgi:hypothetical protein